MGCGKHKSREKVLSEDFTFIGSANGIFFVSLQNFRGCDPVSGVLCASVYNIRKVRARASWQRGGQAEKNDDAMKTKEEIVGNWLCRYTKMPLENFGEQILLTNFNNYVDLFCQLKGVEPVGFGANMRAATADGVTMINFGIGSPNAALIMDLLSAVKPKACLFLGKCGGISDKTQLGDYILPLAGIRGEGTSNDYFPPEVPALPAFMLQRAVSTAMRDSGLDYWTGTVYTTNRRVWEHDERFKQYLLDTRAMAVDMETATLFSCGFYNHIPTGALLLVSDNPMVPEGIKTEESDNKVTANFAEAHVRIGIEAMRLIAGERKTVRHLKYDW